jgi:hypothetical protein
MQTMVKISVLLAMSFAVSSCAYQEPYRHEEIVGSYASTTKQQVWGAVLSALDQLDIPVARKDFVSGTILSDSFTVRTDQVDCGKNFFGVDSPGSRMGVIEVAIRDDSKVQISFELGALLTIAANKKQVVCSSFGKLEQEILESLELKLGLKRDQIKEPG